MLFSLLIFLVTEAAVELVDEELLCEVCEDIACGSCEQTAVPSVPLSSSSMDLNLLRCGVQLLDSVDCSLVNEGTMMVTSCVDPSSASLDGSGSSSSSIGGCVEVVSIIPG